MTPEEAKEKLRAALLCPICKTPMQVNRIGSCYCYACNCYTATYPIRSDGTVLMPDGRVVKVREEMRK